ncbi:MAG: hypothetical protein JSV52_11805 [Candidatus Zixiibacteriota bacterium]|nr:MAG: hypothetical protein JSV52_11805 [candidate division Zixibacteria bacterium]
MKPIKPLTATLIILLVLTIDPLAQVSAEETDSTKVDLQKEYYLTEARHRLFPNFSQMDTGGMNEPFFVGEDENKGEVIAFNPNLGIATRGEALQVSETLHNPAVKARVSLGEEVQQESWGFSVMTAPHFCRKNLFAFRLVDFKVSEKYIEAPAGK